ncbi:MAG: hypothetical protein KKF50_05425 [Nanoarchaeota archaeon]|nr:hypothetical protein [Nanoarchaeota archaeon]
MSNNREECLDSFRKALQEASSEEERTDIFIEMVNRMARISSEESKRRHQPI